MMRSGSLTYSDYIKYFNKNIIVSKKYNTKQIQPSSVDLTLSGECYEISSSFLSPNSTVKDKINKFITKKIQLSKGYILNKNCTYIVKLNEELNLSNNTFGKCNPKSTTGRLDIFCRTIFDFCQEYENIPLGYKGEIYLEITTRAFNIELRTGDSLNQMRLIRDKKNILSDNQLCHYHKKNPIVFDSLNNVINPNISNGLKVSVSLYSKNSIIAYRAKKKSPVLVYNKVKSHKVKDFWHPIKSDRKSIIIHPGEFYILKSKEKIKIPKNMAGEMVPYDTAFGDFRAHYAGFFDPGFGSEYGSHAVLEIRTSEVSFALEDGQLVATLLYENLREIPQVTYGSKIKSNYQNQDLALSKHFNVIE